MDYDNAVKWFGDVGKVMRSSNILFIIIAICLIILFVSSSIYLAQYVSGEEKNTGAIASTSLGMAITSQIMSGFMFFGLLVAMGWAGGQREYQKINQSD